MTLFNENSIDITISDENDRSILKIFNKYNIVKDATLSILEALMIFIALLGFTKGVLYISTETQNIALCKQFFFQYCILYACVIACIIWILNYKKKYFFNNLAAVFFLAFLMWSAFTILFTTYKYAAIEEIYKFISGICLFIIICAFCRQRISAYIIIFTILITGLLTSEYILLQNKNIDFIQWRMEKVPLVSTFGNSIYYFGFITALIPVFFLLIFSFTITTIKNIVKFRFFDIEHFLMNFFAAAIAVLALKKALYGLRAIDYIHGNSTMQLMFDYAKTPYGLIILIIISFSFITELVPCKYGVFVYKKLKMTAISIIISFILIGCGIYFFEKKICNDNYRYHIVDKLRKYRFFTVAYSGGYFYSSSNYKSNILKCIWTGSYRMAKAAALKGHGIGVFRIIFPKFRPDFYNSIGVSHNTLWAHNAYLQIAAETGIIGLVLFLSGIILIIILSAGYSILNKKTFFKNIALGALAGCISFLISSFFTNDLRWTGQSILFWLLLGLSICPAIVKKNENESLLTFSIIKQKILLVLIFVIIIICAVNIFFISDSVGANIIRLSSSCKKLFNYIDKGFAFPDYLSAAVAAGKFDYKSIPLFICLLLSIGWVIESFFCKNKYHYIKNEINKKIRWEKLFPKLTIGITILIALLVLVNFSNKWSARMIHADKKLKKIYCDVDAVCEFTDSENLNSGRYDSIIKDGNEMMELYPYELSAYYKIAFIQIMKGQTFLYKNQVDSGMTELENALNNYMKITKYAPDYAQVHNNIAMIYSQKNRYSKSKNLTQDAEKYLKKALLHFERATQLDGNIRNYQNLVDIYFNEINNNNISRKFCEVNAVRHLRKILKITEWNIKNFISVTENIKERNKCYLALENFYRNTINDISSAEAINKEMRTDVYINQSVENLLMSKKNNVEIPRDFIGRPKL